MSRRARDDVREGEPHDEVARTGDRPPRLPPVRVLRERLEISPERGLLIAKVAFAALIGIMLSGALVRVTGSGLGCPSWPRCDTRLAPTEIGTPVVVEFGNRLLTFVVSAAVIAAIVAALTRRPYRRDLTRLASLLLGGVLLQGIIGGISVLVDLHWPVVALHYLVSAAMLVPAAMLVWRAGHDTPAPPRTPQAGSPLVARFVQGLLPLGFLTLVLGTLATAAGPHSGGEGTGDVVTRFDVRGDATLQWIVERHGLVSGLFGVAIVVSWVLAGRRGASRRLTGALALTGMLVGVQGILGLVQYGLELPDTLVWLHVSLGTLTWSALLWARQLSGRPGGIVAAVVGARDVGAASVEHAAAAAVGAASPTSRPGQVPAGATPP